MGVDTHARLRGYVSPDELARYIERRYNIKVGKYIDVRNEGLIKDLGITYSHKVVSGAKEYIKEVGNLCFTLVINGVEETRSLFYLHETIIPIENEEYYLENGLRELNEIDTTFISLGYWASSVEIMRDIVEEYGGWLDENDCDEYPYYYIRKRRKKKKFNF